MPHLSHEPQHGGAWTFRPRETSASLDDADSDDRSLSTQAFVVDQLGSVHAPTELGPAHQPRPLVDRHPRSTAATPPGKPNDHTARPDSYYLRQP